MLAGQSAEEALDELELLDSSESPEEVSDELPDDEDDPPPLQEIMRRLK